jgi:ADP-ribose pyrophosphatase
MRELVTNARYVYRGTLLKLQVATVEFSNGRETTREIVEHPGAVAIIPLLDRSRMLVVRQYRIAARRHLVEIPAGTLEPGESPVSCAKRELMEETRHAAGRMRKLFSCYLAPGYSTEKIHFFLASKLTPREARQAEDETITVREMSLHEGLRAIENGDVQDAKTICAIYYLATRGKTRARTRRGRRPTE